MNDGTFGSGHQVARQSRFPVLAALLLDRIEVLYDYESVLVSPKDKRAFVQAIRAHQPSVEIEELEE
jgi:PH (Pleckstrin Homology) domain-containing protein